MTSPYVPSGNPATGSEALSALIRAEFVLIAAGIDAAILQTSAGYTAFIETLPKTDPNILGALWLNGTNGVTTAGGFICVSSATS